MLYKDGFRYGALCFLICASRPSCMANCNQYVVSYKLCCITMLGVCTSMLHYVVTLIYEIWFGLKSCEASLLLSFAPV